MVFRGTVLAGLRCGVEVKLMQIYEFQVAEWLANNAGGFAPRIEFKSRLPRRRIPCFENPDGKRKLESGE